MANNRISKVAIVGLTLAFYAGGNVGSFITRALLQTGKHNVTALTRAESNASFPDGIATKQVDYDQPETLVEALRGQDALVITISGMAPMKQIEEKLIRAAGEAGVSWILPNEWSPDSTHDGIVEDIFLFQWKVAARRLIEEIGRSSYVAVVTGFWYEYSLAVPNNYGFDFANRMATFYDEGDIEISTSTWPQVGRAVAALLSLPLQAEAGHGGQCLSQFKNQVVYVNSFVVSQKDMLASALRVTQSKESDWTISKKASREQFTIGMADMKEGRKPSANFLYARIFFPGPDGGGDFEHKGTLNGLLDLPREDLDDATKTAMERQMAGGAR